MSLSFDLVKLTIDEYNAVIDDPESSNEERTQVFERMTLMIENWQEEKKEG